MAAPPSMEAFRAQLGKRYGTRLTPAAPSKQVVSTGSLTLDLALGVGGWLVGRTHEIVGPPQVCKTTLCTLSAAQAQQSGDKAVGWIDMEQSFDFDWAETLGLDLGESRFTHIFPDDSEDVADMLKAMAQTGLYSMIVIDSIGGMESKKAFDKDAEEVTMGRNAQVITRMVKQAASLARQHHITILYVNQLRANLAYAGQDIPAGPRALQYNTTTSVRLSRKGGPAADTTRKIKDGGDDLEVGRQFAAKVTRNRVAPAGRLAEFWLFNVDTDEHGPIGIDRADEAASLGIRTGVIKQSGAFYTLPGASKAHQGRAKLGEALRADAEAVEAVRQAALAQVAHLNKDEDV